MMVKKAKALDMSRNLLRNIVECDLKLNPYKNQNVHSLTKAQKAAKLQKCQQFGNQTTLEKGQLIPSSM
jgi:hypothetical protein